MGTFKVPLIPSSSQPQDSDLKLTAVFDVAMGIRNLRAIPYLNNEHEVVYVDVSEVPSSGNGRQGKRSEST